MSCVLNLHPYVMLKTPRSDANVSLHASKTLSQHRVIFLHVCFHLMRLVWVCISTWNRKHKRKNTCSKEDNPLNKSTGKKTGEEGGEEGAGCCSVTMATPRIGRAEPIWFWDGGGWECWEKHGYASGEHWGNLNKEMERGKFPHGCGRLFIPCRRFCF